MGIKTEGDEAGKRRDRRTQAADIYAQEQRLPVFGKPVQQDRGRDVADNLAGRKRGQERGTADDLLQTGAHIGKGADIARKQEKTHKGQQQAVIDAAKDIPVKQDERSTGEHEQRHVGQDMKNGQQA